MTPRNFYRLMKDKQVALLFPGGVRESNHGKDEAYQLFWPDDRAEFVRVAAAFGAGFTALFTAFGTRFAHSLHFGLRQFAIAVRIGFGEHLGTASLAVFRIEDAVAIRIQAAFSTAASAPVAESGEPFGAVVIRRREKLAFLP